MSKELYAVVLVGQGDTDARLVTKEVFDWITEPVFFPKGVHSIDNPPTPQIVLDGLDEEYDGITVYINSCDNDKALNCVGASVYSCYDLASLFTYIRENDIKVMDAYEGCIY